MSRRRSSEVRSRNNRRLWLPAAVVGALLVSWQVVPLLSGSRAVFFRDLGSTHVPALDLFPTLGVARINPHASFGQPYLGNPNLLVTYRLLIWWTSAEWHLVLHLLLGFAGMVALLRSMHASPAASYLGAVSYSFCGYVLSSLSFLNATTTIAWFPWVVCLAVAETPGPGWVRRIGAVFVLSVFSLTGDPALIVIGLLLTVALALRYSRQRTAFLTGCGMAAVLLTLPLHLETWRAARDSARVVQAYTFTEASAQSLHPVRMVESLIPGFFGSPSFLLQGAWWGFRFSGNELPYVHSVALPFVSLCLVLAAGVASRWRRERLWWSVCVISLAGSMFGFLPLARTLFDVAAPLHFFRYPIKFMLLTSLALAVLGARAFDYWTAEATPEARAVAGRTTIVIGAVCLLLAGYAAARQPVIIDMIASIGWNHRWATPHIIALGPIAAALPVRLFFLAAMNVVIGMTFRRPHNDAWKVLLLLLATIDAANGLHSHVPSVERSRIERRSPLVLAASQLRGPVMELAWKDLDPVRFGLHGRYTSNDAGELAVAQTRQGWALSGAPMGIRYAYNNSPDGSYTWRNQLVHERMQQRRSWDYLLRWLRASGVEGVIAPSLGPPRLGVSILATEDTIGIPARLYRIRDTLPPARRTSSIIWATSAEDALLHFEGPDFDERTSVVVEGPARPLDPGTGTAEITARRPDAITVETKGEGRSMLFLARTYRSTSRAWVNGKPTTIFPSNVHLIAVEVPAGTSIVVIRE